MTETEKKNAGGRPEEWTKEKIKELGRKLEEWARKHDSYALVQFYRDERLTRFKLRYIASKSESFLHSLMYTKFCLASRMIESLNKKDGNCHPVFFNKYIRANDLELDEFMKDQEKAETDEIKKHIVKIVDFAKYKQENGV